MWKFECDPGAETFSPLHQVDFWRSTWTGRLFRIKVTKQWTSGSSIRAVVTLFTRDLSTSTTGEQTHLSSQNFATLMKRAYRFGFFVSSQLD